MQIEAPLAPLTSFRIGGGAGALLTVNEIENLIAALNVLYQHQIPFLILGGGSNVLISDAGIPGVVILNQCRAMHWPSGTAESHIVQVEAGAPLAGFARASIKHGLAGLAWAISVPGTIGGAVVGNAGAHGGCIADNLHDISLWTAGRVEQTPADRLNLSYRRSVLKPLVNHPGFGPVVLAAAFSLAPDLMGQEQARAEAFIEHRRRTQPIDKSAGSIFQNPPGDFAGRLIEAAGLKGASFGGASVSTQHANFIINPSGQATAADVIQLMNLIRRGVFDQFGVILQPEIQFLGDWSHGPQLAPLP